MLLNELIAEIDKRKEQLDAFGELSDDVKKRLEEKIRLDWNYHSNAIEGNQLSLGETKSLLLYGLTAKGKSLKDVLDMKGHEKGLQRLYSIVNKEVNITEKVVMDFHSIIMSDPFEDNKEVQPGKYKTVPNEIIINEIGEKVEFTMPENVVTEINKLINWLSNVMNPPKRDRKKYTLHPLLIAATFHLEFVLIHPFADGNGRMSRILMNLILMQCGFPPIVIKVEERTAYINALNRSRNEGVEIFAEFLGECLLRSLDMYINAAEGKPIEESDDVDKRIAVLTTRLAKSGKIRYSPEEAMKTIAEIAIPFFTHAAIKTQKIDKFFVDKTIYFEWSYFRQGKLLAKAVLESNKLIAPDYWTWNHDELEAIFKLLPITERYNKETPLLRAILKTNDDKFKIEALDKVSLMFHWSRFVEQSMPELEIEAVISFSLTPDGYSIRINDKMLHSNSYGNELTEDEQNNIISTMINSVLASIEAHIAKSTKDNI